MHEALLAFVLTAAAVSGALPVLRRAGLIDHPSRRSSHSVPTVRGAGIGIAVGALVALTVSDVPQEKPALVVFPLLCSAVGLVDDAGNLSIRWRLLAQLAAATVTAVLLLGGTDIAAPQQALLGLGLVVWLVGFVNTFNFFDGLNGLAVSQGVSAGAAWAVVGWITHEPLLAVGGAIIGASCLAFAPFNFPAARAFLGDVGSYFIGAWLAVLTVVGVSAGVAPEAVLAPLAILLADTVVTRARRLSRGGDWYLPNREHVYQRLNDEGWSHQKVTTVAFAGGLACSALGLASLSDSIALRVAGDLGVVLVAGAYLCLPRYVRHHPVSSKR